MILEEATKEAFGYHPRKLKPQSHKLILAVCELCGEFRALDRQDYHTFCNSCSRILGGKLKGNKFGLGHKLTEEHKAIISAAQKGKTFTEETKAKIRAAHKGMSGRKHTDESKTKMSAAHRGENNPAWLGGISFEPYCVKFNNEFKDYIREKFGNKCFLCKKTTKANGRKLGVHHVNYNKDCGCDGDLTCQFVPLCMSCHTKTGNNREYWFKFIMDKLHNTIIGWDV